MGMECCGLWCCGLDTDLDSWFSYLQYRSAVEGRPSWICSTFAAPGTGRSTFAAPAEHLSASRNVGVYWWVISYNIYRIIKLLARYTRNNSKNMRFAARSQHSSSERSTFAAPRVVLVKIHGCEINKYIIIRLSVKSQRLTPNIRGDILILRIGFFFQEKNPISWMEWASPLKDFCRQKTAFFFRFTKIILTFLFFNIF